MLHLDEGILSALLDGELSGTQQREAETHLRACDECSTRLEELRGLMVEADQLVVALGEPADSPAVPPLRVPAKPRRRSYRALAWAASIVLAVGLGFAGSTLLMRGEMAARDATISSGPREEPQPAPAASPGPVGQQPATGGSSPANRPSSAAPVDLAAAESDQKARREASRDDSAREAAGDSAVEIRRNEIAGMLAPSAASSRVLSFENERNNEAALRLDRTPEQGILGSARLFDSAGAGRQRVFSEKPPEAFAKAAVPTAAASGGAGPGQAAEREAANRSRSMTDSVLAREVAELRSVLGDVALVIEPVFRPVTMEEAVRRLSGAIRLIDGLTPDHIEMAFGSTAPIIRVVYQVGPSRAIVFLDQQRISNERDGGLPAQPTGPRPVERQQGQGNSVDWQDGHGFSMTLTAALSVDSLLNLKARVK